MNAIVLFNYLGISVDKDKSCYFYEDIFFGISDILLFSLSLYMAYKLYTVSNNFYEFAVNGRLTSESVQKRNRYILLFIFVSSSCDLFVFLFLNVYWTYIERDIPKLDLFMFVNRIYQMLLCVTNAFLFYWSYRMFKKTFKETIIDKRYKRLFRAQRMMFCMGAFYLGLICTILFGLYS